MIQFWSVLVGFRSFERTDNPTADRFSPPLEPCGLPAGVGLLLGCGFLPTWCGQKIGPLRAWQDRGEPIPNRQKLHTASRRSRKPQSTQSTQWTPVDPAEPVDEMDLVDFVDARSAIKRHSFGPFSPISPSLPRASFEAAWPPAKKSRKQVTICFHPQNVSEIPKTTKPCSGFSGFSGLQLCNSAEFGANLGEKGKDPSAREAEDAARPSPRGALAMERGRALHEICLSRARETPKGRF